MSASSFGHEFRFADNFANTGSKGFVYDKEEPMSSRYNLFGALFRDVPPELMIISSVSLCARKIEYDKLPNFLELVAAIYDESANRITNIRDNDNGGQDTGSWRDLFSWIPVIGGLFKSVSTEPSNSGYSDELDSRRHEYIALKEVYDNKDERLYFEYCKSVDNAEKVADKLGLEITNFPSFQDFKLMESDQKNQFADRYFAAMHAAVSMYEGYIDAATKVSEFLLPESEGQEKLNHDAFIKMFVGENPRLIIEQEVKLMEFRCAYIDNKLALAEMAGNKMEHGIEEKHLFGPTIQQLEHVTQMDTHRIALIRDVGRMMAGRDDYNNGVGTITEEVAKMASFNVEALEQIQSQWKAQEVRQRMS